MGVDDTVITSTVRLVLAVLAGGVVGLERTYHGRPAGFRTHTLVCTASSLLMLVTVYQVQLLPDLPLDAVRVDPTRMAQGIMTGIGFLGAGVIMKEGLSVRGLTTAASIWITAAIGILIGLGFHYPALIGVALTLGTLAVFRWIEAIMPSYTYARLKIRFHSDNVLDEARVNAIIAGHQISGTNLSYHADEEHRYFEYDMTIRSRDENNIKQLVSTLRQSADILRFDIQPVGQK